METLKKFISEAPEKPGLYKIYDIDKNLIYVGKAKNLKKRISQYLKPLSDRMQQILYKLADVEFIVTKNEIEALIIEAENIRKLQPKYNILLKDDKSYPFIKITDHIFPRIVKYRGIKTDGCYGPFTSSAEMKQTILALQKAFLIRGCSDSFFSSRKKPCMEYQIKRCSAPCTGKITPTDYAKMVSDAKLALMGNVQKIQDNLLKLMHEASEKMDYEIAAIYRDKLRLLQNLQSLAQNQIYTTQDSDYIGIYSTKGECAINIISYRVKEGFGNYNFYFENLADTPQEELLEQFILQFYTDNVNMPQNIYLNFSIQKQTLEALKKISGRPVTVKLPKTTTEIETLNLAHTKAETHLKSKLFQEEKMTKCLSKVKQYFNLEQIPKSIEAYDNSHSFGEFAVSTMVTVTKEGFNKKNYRNFKIKNKTGGNDHMMMKEVLTRRFKKDWPNPDFILIDGGKGHVQMVKEIVGDIPFVCITKGEGRKLENDHFYSSTGKLFNVNDNELLYFLQNIRNEAHKSAIKFYRKIHNKSYTKSTIDDIPGIGSTRKKILLTYFKNIEDIKNSSPEEIAKIKGFGKKVAKKILEFLNNAV